MLYVTTRSKFDAQTTTRALADDRGPDGGLYLPFQMPKFSAEEVAALAEKTFGQCVADILNLFFSCRLTGLDVDFCIGRNPVKLDAMNHRIVIAELWHNLDSDYARTERDLAAKICSNLGCEVKLTSWLRIAIRLSVLFGIFAQLQSMGAVSVHQSMDVAVPVGDFSSVMSVWLARSIGLPIANIICSCNENSGVWELLHLGELHTDAAVTATTTPLADVAVPMELERLIHAAIGQEEAIRFADVTAKRRIYRPQTDLFGNLKKGMFSAVVSRSRLDALIPSVYRTNSYILGPYTALAYGGLMDYRAKTGETRPALLLAERSPICDSDVVTDSMRMTVSELKAELDKV